LTEVISVRFRNGCKTYYFDPHGIQVHAGQHVIVETASGNEYVTCTEGNHEVNDESVVQPLRPIIRVATENDRRTDMYNREREKEAFGICEKKIAAHGLEMKLIRVESNFDGSKIIFFFTAEGRVDFRELVKDLANVFRARIELRQVGVRDEAKMLGGLGICGRPLCCSQFLEEFVPVSIKMAKTQNLSLNPTKISGTCGRLMCCLKYEQNAYEDAVKRMPKNDSFVNTPDGPGNVVAVDLLKEEVKVRLDESPETQKTYKGCEIVVLRNGKGSRDGIEIPKERPARYVTPEEKKEPVQDFGSFLYGFHEESVPEIEDEEESPKREAKRPSRRRRGRGGEKKAEAAKADTGKVERIAVKVTGDLTAEKKAAADRKAHSDRRRGKGSEKKAEKQPQEKVEKAPKSAKPAHLPKAAKPQTAEKKERTEKAAGEGAKQPHRRHRPHRRRPSGGNKPSGEA